MTSRENRSKTLANKQRVDLFNFLKGNAPVGTYNREDFWKQIQEQAALILEKAKEQYEAAMNFDLVEVIDGFCDVDYLQEYQATLLKAAGVMLECSKDTVSLNNAQKYTVVYEFAVQSAEALKEKGEDVYINEAVYEGQVYYIVNRTSDNKVMKLLKHVPPNIASTIPETTMLALGG